MFYRETGDFKTSYSADTQTFPIKLDRYRFWAIAIFAGILVPLWIASVPRQSAEFFVNPILLPFLIFSLAAIGLNILTGYCGQVSLGTGGFMAVGAYACYKLTTAFPDLNLVLVIFASGAITAGVGVLFGLPSLRIKGFYLAVATLAAQFFLTWMFSKFGWFYNNSATGQITMPPREVFGIAITGPDAAPWATYFFCFFFVFVMGWAARNLVRGRVGRSWMAIRDMDIAAEIIGVNPLKTKLSAFAVSSFLVGIAGALYFGVWYGSAEPTEAFGITLSFQILFMIIIGGLGSMTGSFLGAGFMVLLPILLKKLMVDMGGMEVAVAKHIEIVVVGALIILFLILEPHGLARLWQLAKEKLRLWPFPY
ncbi:MAG: branched-chain amino acid ABC transporter permease [Neomegalonema sp.]|nr:branched-chain amino acid ABC transporter permease [Neomegalonema sp.]